MTPDCCRICYDDLGSLTDSIRPCKCAGTSAFVHRVCLDTWRLGSFANALTQCPSCKTDYKFKQNRVCYVVPVPPRWMVDLTAGVGQAVWSAVFLVWTHHMLSDHVCKATEWGCNSFMEYVHGIVFGVGAITMHFFYLFIYLVAHFGHREYLFDALNYAATVWGTYVCAIIWRTMFYMFMASIVDYKRRWMVMRLCTITDADDPDAVPWSECGVDWAAEGVTKSQIERRYFVYYPAASFVLMCAFAYVMYTTSMFQHGPASPTASPETSPA